MKRPKLVVDIDDTTLAWHKSFYQFLIHDKGFKPTSLQPSTYALEDWLGISREQSLSLISEFNERSDYFGSLSPIAGAEKSLVELGVYFDIFLASAFTSSPETINKRLQNIEDAIPDVDYVDFYALPLNSSKRELFQHLQSLGAVAVIDDSTTHAGVAVSLGLEGILFAQSHNDPTFTEVPNGVLRLNGWEEVKNYLIKKYCKDV